MTRVQTPKIIQTTIQRSQIMEMKRKLDDYWIMEGQNICEHIITMYDMMQKLIFTDCRGLWTEKVQYQYLLITLLPHDKEFIASI